MTSMQSTAASNFNPSGHQNGKGSAHEYLRTMIRCASPPRLRLLVLERAVETASMLASVWRTDGARKGPNEWSIKLLDMITELLSGVTSDEGVGSQVADLYVFLSKHLVAAEQTSNAEAIDEIRLVLKIETETWRMVCAQETVGSTAESANSSGGLNLEC